MSEEHMLCLSDDNHYPYQIVHSKRAKYVRIKLSGNGALSVVLPKGMPAKLAHNFIKDKTIWVENNLQKVPARKNQKAPEILDLKLLNESWKINYIIADKEQMRIVELPGLSLRITGAAEQLGNTEILYKNINHWCKKKAKNIFNQKIEQLAELHGFHYQRLSIRSQKTRWGSCSNKKNINLNAKLLFMPEKIVNYVMIHELCHTIEMNHSHRF